MRDCKSIHIVDPNQFMQHLSLIKKGLGGFSVLLILLTGCAVHYQDLEGRLRRAVLVSDTKSTEHYILQGADVNSRDHKRGWTPLLYATEAGDEKIVSLLLRYEADPNMVSTQDEISALHRAASNGHLEIAKKLIDSGADINCTDTKLRSTPLMWAVFKRQQSIVRLLLDNKALINVRGHRGESALLIAVSNQDVDIVRLLLAHDAIRDRPDIYGVTPLQEAIRLNNKEIINLLREK